MPLFKSISPQQKLPLFTGVLVRGVISINVGDGTKIDITAGQSLYVDDTDPLFPVVEVLSWPQQTALLPPSLGTNLRLWIGVSRSAPGVGNIVFSTSFTPAQKRSIAVLGRVWGAGTTTVTGVGQYATPAWGSEKALEDLVSTLGSRNRNGNVFSGDVGTLTLSKNAGSSFRFAGASGVDMNSPNMLDDASQTAISAYYYHIGTAVAGTTVLNAIVDVGHYDSGGGVLAAVPINKFTVQRVYFFPGSGVVDVVYGQALYDALVEAETHAATENVVLFGSHQLTLEGSVLRAWVCVAWNAADLSDPAQAVIVTASNGGAGSSGGAGGGAVDSVNGHVGIVVLTPDDLDDTATTHKFTSQADKTRLASTSGTNTGDQTTSNGGVGGVGLPLPASGSDLPFKSLLPGNRITLTDDAINHRVQIDCNLASERVVSDTVGHTIVQGTSWTLSIPLSRADYTRGELVMNIPQAVAKPVNTRCPGYYKFTTSINDAQGVTTDFSTNFISLCVYYDRWPSGFAYRIDGKLSNTITWDKGGAGTIQLTSIRINGAALELVFTNTNALYPADITVYVTADVWKVS